MTALAAIAEGETTRRPSKQVEQNGPSQVEARACTKWLAGTLAQVKALADDHTELQRIERTMNGHTERLQHIEQTVNDQTERLDLIEHDVKGLRRDMPGIVADALRATRTRRTG